MKVYQNIFPLITSPENLFAAWETFKRDKRNKPDVAMFGQRVEQYLFQLHRELKDKTYRHGPYEGFLIRDPKLRRIHKAAVRDRVLHHAIFKIVNPVFEETFIPTSFSCRIGKGTHKGVRVLEKTVRKVAKNGANPCFVLKCDIKKFFESVDHEILLTILKRRIKDENAMWLLTEVVESFFSPNSMLLERKGLPIGNLTSQLFANIYLNELDRFVKHDLRVRYYLRYTDDFLIVSRDRKHLEALILPLTGFLDRGLKLVLHPRKVHIRKLHQGIDFLGYVQFPYHRLLRAKTGRRIMARVDAGVSWSSLQSYLGIFSHADCYRLSQELQNLWWFSYQE